MSLGYSACKLAGLFSVVAFACTLRAEFVTVNSGEISATAGDQAARTKTFSSDSYDHRVREKDSHGSSRVTADIDADSFTFGIKEHFSGIDFMSGFGKVTFTADTGLSYSLTGSATMTGASVATANFDVSLFNMTTGKYLYDYTSTGPDFTLGVGGGSLTGKLISGDQYTFEVDGGLASFSDPKLNGSATLSFAPLTTAPENPALLIPVALGGLAVFRSKLRRRMSASA